MRLAEKIGAISFPILRMVFDFQPLRLVIYYHADSSIASFELALPYGASLYDKFIEQRRNVLKVLMKTFC